MCSQVDLVNRLTLCPCKLTLVKIILQKLIILFINPYNNHKTTTIITIFRIVSCIVLLW